MRRLDAISEVMPEGTEQLGKTFNKDSDLPGFDNPPALEFVNLVETHEYQDNGATVIDDANDHPDLAPYSPKLFGPRKLLVPFVEVMCLCAVHHQPITIASKAGCSRLLRRLLILLRREARKFCILSRNQPRMDGPYFLIRTVMISAAVKIAARLIASGEDATALMMSLHSVVDGTGGTVATTGIPPGVDWSFGILGMEGSCPNGVTNPLSKLIWWRFVKYSAGENIVGVQKTVVQHPPVGGPRHR